MAALQFICVLVAVLVGLSDAQYFQPSVRCPPQTPPYPNIFNYQDQCRDDKDCAKCGKLCCYDYGGMRCLNPIHERCPAYGPTNCTAQAFNCKCDCDCPKGFICCPNSCGTGCVPLDKDGECPCVKYRSKRSYETESDCSSDDSDDSGSKPSPPNHCNYDADCPKNQKCCRQGKVKMCTTPVKERCCPKIDCYVTPKPAPVPCRVDADCSCGFKCCESPCAPGQFRCLQF